MRSKINLFTNNDSLNKKFFILKSKRTLFMTLLLSALFSFFMIFGKSFALDNSWDLVMASSELKVKSLFIFFGYTALFTAVLYIIFFAILAFEVSAQKRDCQLFSYSTKGFLSCWVLLLLFWLPYIIAFYPGIANSDVSDQLAMFYNFDNGTYQWVDFPIEGSYRHGHHPYFNTLMHGIWLEIGIKLFSSQNIGVFLHCLCQTLFTTAIFSYIIISFDNWKLSAFYRVLVFIIIAIVPCFPLYGINLIKNTVYTDWLLIYCILLSKMIFNSKDFWSKKLNILLLIASILFQILHMKYGIYVVVISAVPVLIIYRKYWKKCFTAYLLPILFYFIVFENILFPLWKVAPGSEREKYSIPFQQTARYIKDFGDEVTSEEKEVIDKIFVYDNIARVYNPQTSDAVKFHAFRGISAEEDIQNYLKIWFSMLWKHPGVYVEAAMNECFGFFYPGFTEHWTNYYEFTSSINNFGDGFFEIYHPEELAGIKSKISEWGASFEFIPFLKMLYRSGSYMWVLLWAAVIVIICKKSKYLIALSPMLITILVCITSPYNANTRYALPLILGVGYIVGIALKAIKEE